MTYRQQHSDHWLQHFAAHGHPAAEPAGAGTEGAVYRLGDGTVAKVWSGRPPAEFDLTRQVYDDIAAHPLPFATPRVLRTEDVDGTLVSHERELPGAPFHPEAQSFDEDLPAAETAALLTVLRGLARVPGTPAMRRLTAQGDDRPLWQGADRFPDALAALVERAARRRPGLLAARLPGLDTAAATARLAARLRALPDTPDTVVHGDLVPPNLHVDAAGRPVAVLDFGFLTTAGDPAFDAAVTAAVWDMYGPHAARHADRLTALFAAELGHDPRTLALYQAAYAVATHDLFSADGSDGHFAWCADLLRRSTALTA